MTMTTVARIRSTAMRVGGVGWDGVDGMRCMVWGGWDGGRWNGMKLSKISHGCDANEIALSSQLYGTDRTGTHDTDSRELMFLTDNAGTFFFTLQRRKLVQVRSCLAVG